MNKNVHDTDDFFRSAYKQFEADPPALAWEKINSKLDRKDLASKKSRFHSWKRVAIIMLILPACFALFDSNIFKKKSAVSNDVVLTNGSHPTDQGPVKNDENKVGESDTEKITVLLDEKLKTQNQLHVKYQIANPNRNKKNAQEHVQGFDNILMEQKKLTEIHSPVTAERTSPDIAIDWKNQPVFKTSSPFIPHTLNKSTGAQKEIKHSFTPSWSMSAFVSYDRVNYRLDSDIPNYITSIKHREKHEPSFSFGVLVSRQLTDQWSLQSGLVYSTIAIGISPQKMYAFQDPQGNFAYKYITSSGYAFIKPGFSQSPNFGDSLTSAEAEHTINSIGIPVMAKFRIGNSRLTLIPGAGVELNFITRAEVEVELLDEFNRELVSIHKLNGSKSFYLAGVAEAELRYDLNKKIAVSLHPTFRYALSPITENNVVETFPYSLGIRAGITRKF